MNHFKKNKNETSWEKVDQWYDSIVGKEGHYYHQHVVLPGVTRLLDLVPSSSLLDLGCGQGILSRKLPDSVHYTGIDLSSSLIQKAKEYTKNKEHRFFQGDICQPLPLKEKNFTHATMILCLQNVEFPEKAIAEAASHLQKNGKLIIVLNHPMFRIPRQTAWGIDESQNLQYRRINRYLTPLQIPIQAHPGKSDQDTTTWSFHHPLSSFIAWLSMHKMAIISLEEWISDKKSEGKQAKRENFARQEFPLFLTLVAQKLFD